MGRLGRILAWIGAITVLLVVVLVVVAVKFSGKAPVPDRTILTVNFEQPIVEYIPDDPFSKILSDKALVLRDVVGALDRAANDDRVVGLVARIGGSQTGFAQIQELREAVLAFRKRGKPAVAYAETFGEFGPGNGAYYLASAFDKRYLQPSGDVGLTGLVAESPFVKGTLNKVGIEPRLDHRYEYKNAMNLFTETKYTDAHREATEEMVHSLYTRMLSDIATDIGTTADALRLVVDRGPILGPDAVSSGLVDSLAYYDEITDRMKENLGPNAEFLSLKKYLDRAGDPYGEGTTVALIYGVGDVVRGDSEMSPVSGQTSMGADTVTKAFRDAVKDKSVKAILFRVDSPGGSYVASDAIWREVTRAKQAGKPVVVTMGNVAASGGYFVSMNASKIVAQPGTITGSIGVLGGKMLTLDAWKKIGVTWDEVHVGDNALFWSSGADYTPEQWAKFEAWLDRVYDDFTTKVAQGRGLEKSAVLPVARGRVWTGEDARARGLVDDLGGFTVALKWIRQQIGLEEDTPIHLKVFPKPKSILDQIVDKGFVGVLGNGDVLARTVRDLQPVFRVARAVGLIQPTGVLEAPVWQVK